MAGRPQEKPARAPDLPIPEKLYFKIGEVAELVGVQPHVLRYWEKEIPAIRPAKSTTNQRRYRRRDVEFFREIRRLLYEERYTLAGARRRLTGRGPEVEEPEAGAQEPPKIPAAPEGAPVAIAAAAAPSPAAPSPEQEARLARARQGLRELIRLAGEMP